MNTLANCIEKLLDETQVFKRKEWSAHLSISEPAMSQWTQGETCPRADILQRIIDVIKIHGDTKITQKILDEFNTMSLLPIEKVTSRKSFKGAPNIASWLASQQVAVLKFKIAKIPASQQGDVIKQISNLLDTISSMKGESKINQILEDIDSILKD